MFARIVVLAVLTLSTRDSSGGFALAFAPSSIIISRAFGGDSRGRAAIVGDRLFSTNTDAASDDGGGERKRRPRKKRRPRRIKSASEKARDELRRSRQLRYEEVMTESRKLRVGKNGTDADSAPAPHAKSMLFNFESLFPEPVWDDEAVYKDLYEISDRDEKEKKKKYGSSSGDSNGSRLIQIGKDAATRNQGMKRIMRRPTISNRLPYDPPMTTTATTTTTTKSTTTTPTSPPSKEEETNPTPPIVETIVPEETNLVEAVANSTDGTVNATAVANKNVTVDRTLSRMVEDRVYGFKRAPTGEYSYDTSLMGNGAVKFREGRRIGNPLKINADRLTYHARQALRRGKYEEARDMYSRAVDIDPVDGRGWLGLSRVAEARKDAVGARETLRRGLRTSVDPTAGDVPNAFLLQALGRLEERAGHLTEAERLYERAAEDRPWHAAAWVALGQLRTRKLRRSAEAGRECYRRAERGLAAMGRRPSSHVYSAWASLEYKKAGDPRRARELFDKAIEADPRCSAAFLQLGCMESDRGNHDRAKECFEKVLEFDQRNSRVLQAYAIMETKRPGGNSRDAIDLFERALGAKPRDAGVLQAYGLYVSKLGDVDAARDLLRRATKVDKKHAPAWQAWGVLETRYGSPEDARDVFQQGIWACAQSGGGQSGGRHCARLWQAWGVLENREGDHVAARRCFSRALDADGRNVATLTAWTAMEAERGELDNARYVFESALRRFSPGSADKTLLWEAYEKMEAEAGYVENARSVYRRSVRETMSRRGASDDDDARTAPPRPLESNTNNDDDHNRKDEVEVVSWRSRREFGEEQVWMNKGSIEGKIPSSKMKKKKQQQQPNNTTTSSSSKRRTTSFDENNVPTK